MSNLPFLKSSPGNDAFKLDLDKVRSLLELAGVGFCLIDTHGTALEFNAIALQLHGFSSQAEMLTHLDQYRQQFELRYPDGRPMPPEDWPACRAMRGEFVRDYEVMLLRPRDPQPRYVTYSTMPIHDPQGRGGLHAFLMVDHTERKQAEQALRDSEQRLRLALDGTDQGFWEIDLESEAVIVSPLVAKMFGVDPHPLETRSDWRQFVLEEDRPGIQQAIQKAAADEGTRYSAEFRVRRGTDGAVRWLHSEGQLLNDALGRRARLIGVIQDITERKQAELELERLNRQLEQRVQERTAQLADKNRQLQAEIAERRHAEQAARAVSARYRLLVERLPAITYAAAINGTSSTTYISPEIERVLGYTPAEYYQDPEIWLRQLHPEDRERVLAELAQSHATGRPFESVYRMVSKDGRLVWFRDHAAIVRDREGVPHSLHGVMLDITETKLAEERLAALHRIVNAGPVAVMAWRIEPGHWPVVLASENVERLFGYTAEDFTSGRISWPALTHPEDKPRLEHEVEAFLRGGAMQWSQEYRIFARDGSIKWIEDFNHVTLDPDGHASQIQAILVNITPRKLAEERLVASETRYHRLVENLNDIIYVCNAEGLIEFVSPQVDQYGYDPQAMVGRPVFDFILPEERERIGAEFQRTIRTGEEFLSEFRVLDARGGSFWVEDHGRVRREGNGQITGLTGVLRDVTASRMMEEALRESEANFRGYFENVAIGAAQVDSAGHFIRVNDRFCAITGYSREELLGGMGPLDLDFPEDREPDAEGLRGLPQGKSYELEKRYLTKTGQPVWVHVTVSAIFDAAGRFRCSAAVIEDITDRKRAEEAVRRQSHQLRALASELTLAEQRVRRRVAEVLHDDLQQLLVGAKLRLGKLGRHAEPASRQALTDIQALLEDAIECSRTLTGELSPPILYQGGLVPALSWLMQWMQQKHALTVELQVDEAAEPPSEEIKVLLFQSARELLFNVVKHSRVGEARLGLERAAGHLVLTVADAGAGFDPARIDERTDSAGGFGLFSIRERLDLLGGRLEIDSAPGRGSRFRLQVPLPPAREET